MSSFWISLNISVHGPQQSLDMIPEKMARVCLRNNVVRCFRITTEQNVYIRSICKHFMLPVFPRVRHRPNVNPLFREPALNE